MHVSGPTASLAFFLEVAEEFGADGVVVSAGAIPGANYMGSRRIQPGNAVEPSDAGIKG